MMPRLRDEDRLAVDLLLDRAASSAGNGHGNGHSGFTSGNGVGPQQIARVEAMLRVLTWRWREITHEVEHVVQREHHDVAA